MTAHGDHDVLRSMLRELEREAPNMSEALIPADRNRAFPGAIFVAAQWALQPIRLALLTARRETVDTILDLPCGSGRVLRALRAEFPHAHITACDINPHVVDYCAETFGATPVYSRENPEDIEIEGPFDLIWCGSLLTHLDQPLWTSFLRMFESLLEPGGVLVFTTCGRFAAERLRRHNLGFTDAQAEELLRRYDQDGFGYCDYAMSAEERAEQFLPHYGLAVATPQWTCARLQEDAWRLDLLSYTAGGHGDRWGDHRPSNGYNGQDFVSCIRIKGEREARAGGSAGVSVDAELVPERLDDLAAFARDELSRFLVVVATVSGSFWKPSGTSSRSTAPRSRSASPRVIMSSSSSSSTAARKALPDYGAPKPTAPI